MSFPSSSALSSYSSMLIAQQLTLLTLERFSLIYPRHLVAKPRASLPPHLNQMKLSNTATLFVASHILCAPSPSARSAVFRKWIKVASILFQLSNWNAVFEVMYGLTHHAVWRLRMAEEVGGEERDNFTKLCLFVSSEDNYGVYRRVLRGVKEGAGGAGWRMPYLGVVLKDLVAMEESQLVVRVDGRREAGEAGKAPVDELKKREEATTKARDGRGGAATSVAPPPSFVAASSMNVHSVSSSQSTASVSSMSSLGSINSMASTDSGGGSINVDSVESDLFGDDGSGSLVLPSLLSASLHSAHASFSSPAPPPSSLPTLSSSSFSLLLLVRPPPTPAAAPASSSSAAPLSPELVFVNFTKCQQIHALITTTLDLPSTPPFAVQPDVHRLLVEGQQCALTEKQLMDRSLVIQPRKAGSSGGVPGVAGGGGGGGGAGEGQRKGRMGRLR